MKTNSNVKNKSKKLLVLGAALFVLIASVIGVYTYKNINAHAASNTGISGAFGFNCYQIPAPTLRLGSTGPCVQSAQWGLNNWINFFNAYSGKTVYQLLVADGSFGPKTQQAVKNYQTNRGLTVDGVIGDKTWTKFTNDCLWWGTCFVGK